MTAESIPQLAREFYYCWACLRAEQKAGRKLTPQEMDEAVQREKAAHG